MVFLREEYWNGLPFPSPGDLISSGIKPTSPAWADRLFFFYHCTTWEAAIVNSYSIFKKNFFKKENRQVNLKMSLCTLSRTIKKVKNQMYISTFTERYLFIQVGQMSQNLEPKA